MLVSPITGRHRTSGKLTLLPLCGDISSRSVVLGPPQDTDYAMTVPTLIKTLDFRNYLQCFVIFSHHDTKTRVNVDRMSFCTLLDKFVSETYYHDAQMLLF